MKREQVLALIDSAMEGDADRFRGVSLQIAASASRQEHHAFHDAILARLNRPRPRRCAPTQGGGFAVAEPLFARGQEIPHELRGALDVSYPDRGMVTMTLAPDVKAAMEEIVRERSMAPDLRAAGLNPATRVAFTGPPGTGKTTGAAVLAAELGWPLLTFKMHGIVKQHLGETSAMLALAMEHCRKQQAVVLVDEVDSIGAARGNDGASSGRELDRIVNTLLVMLDAFAGAEGLLVAATNFPESLDPALWRRFDAVVGFPLPGQGLLEQAMRAAFAEIRGVDTSAVDWLWVPLLAAADGHSFATVTMACRSAAKRAVLNGTRVVTTADIERALGALRPVRKEPA